MIESARTRSESRSLCGLFANGALRYQAGPSTLSNVGGRSAQAPLENVVFVSLSVVDLDGPAQTSDGTLNGIGGSHPSRPGHFLNGAEARITNVAVIGGRSCAQDNRAPGGNETRRLSTRHLGSCRPLLGHGACSEAHHEKGYHNRSQAESPPSGSRPLQQVRPASVPRGFHGPPGLPSRCCPVEQPVDAGWAGVHLGRRRVP